MPHSIIRRSTAPLAAAALVAALGGCGSSTSRTASAGTTSPATVARTSTSVARAPARNLRIVSPRRGARTGQTVSVRVRLTGVSGAANRLRFRVDRSRTRSGGAHLVLRGLSPGRHRLVVTLAGDSAVRASTEFVVLPPPTPASPAPAAQAFTQTSTSSTFTAPQTSTAAPAPPVSTTTRTTSAPSTTHTTSAGGVPQGGGGDGDADNSGGPSDGDGNV